MNNSESNLFAESFGLFIKVAGIFGVLSLFFPYKIAIIKNACEIFIITLACCIFCLVITPLRNIVFSLFGRNKSFIYMITLFLFTCLSCLTYLAKINNFIFTTDISFINCAISGSPEEVQQFIDDGADVNMRDEQGWTPLMYASKYNHDEKVIKILIDNGARVNIKGTKGVTVGDTALHLASAFNRVNICKVLLEYGADINAQTNQGKTPLHVLSANAAEKFFFDLFMKHGANIDLCDDNKLSTLHYALFGRGDISTLKILLDIGANINAKDNDGMTPLYIAVAKNNLEAVQFLLSQGADPNIYDNNFITPLQFAVNKKMENIISLLMNYKIDTAIRNKNGKILYYYDGRTTRRKV